MWWFWIVFAIYAVVSATGLLLIKIGTDKTEFAIQKELISLQTSPMLVLGLALYICSFILAIYVVSNMKLSVFYPVGTGVILVLTSIMSVLVLKEHMGVMQIIGAVLILCGIVFMNVRA